MGKSTISMVIFNSYVSHYQRVYHLNHPPAPEFQGAFVPACLALSWHQGIIPGTDYHDNWRWSLPAIYGDFGDGLFLGYTDDNHIDHIMGMVITHNIGDDMGW